jgi:HD-GYP domain-containing protein (c-di-GMP phosphodiesterase class II)
MLLHLSSPLPIFSIIGYISAIVTFFLGTFVLYKDANNIINKTGFILTLCISIWSFGLASEVISPTKNIGLFWSRFLHVGVIFIPAAYLHFINSFLDYNKRNIFLIKLAYFIATLLFLFNLFGLVVKDVSPKLFFNYYTDPGILYPLLLFTFFIFTAYAFILLIKKAKKVRGYKRNQLLYIAFASIIGFSGGSLTYLPVFNIDSSLVLAGQLVFILYPMLIAYAIIRHRLMDIEIVIRETAIFAGIFGFSIGLFMLAIAAGEQVLQPYLGQSRWIVPAFSLLIVTIAIRPIEKLVYNVVGKYLFRKKFEYQQTLQDAAEGMSKIRDPKKLLNLIVHILSSKLKLVSVSVLLYDNRQERYRMKASRGKVMDKFMSLSPESPLIAWLSEKKKPLTSDDIQKWASSALGRNSLGVLKSDILQIQERMKELEAAVCVPCFFREELLGILSLGEKKTGDLFSQDDLDLFSALSDEAAIALKNSQLYFEIDKKANELEALYKREHRLFMHASIAFAAAIDARDPYTHGHSERVTNISLAILDHISSVDDVDRNPLFRQRLQVAAVLHDVGKIGVPDDILHKPAKLTPKEEKQMQKHPTIGAEIVSHIKGLRDLIGGIKYHHERYDGKGYPEGLKSDQIPFMARIISVADTFDAMTSDRPYRNGLDSMIAREEIQKNAATQFDPFMVAAFLKAFEEGKVK